MLPLWLKTEVWKELAASLSVRVGAPVVFNQAVFGKLSYFQELRNRLSDSPFSDVPGIKYVRVPVEDSEIVVGPFRTNESHVFDEELSDARLSLPEWNDSFSDLIDFSVHNAVVAGRSEVILKDSLFRAKLLLEFSQSLTNVNSIERALFASVNFLVHKFKLNNMSLFASGKRACYFDLSLPSSSVEQRIVAQVKSTRSSCVVRNVQSDFLLEGIEDIEDVSSVVVGLPVLSERELVGWAVLFCDSLPQLDGISEVLYELGVVISRLSQFESVKESSITDSLTGLFNRSELVKVFDSVLPKLSESNLPVSVLMVDIDNFKKLNDTKGHLEGDRVLKSVAEVIKSVTPKDCICARYGGEEFALFLPNFNSNGAKDVAESLRAGVENSCELTVSVGVMTCMNSAISRETLIREADRALYRAKDLGKNRVIAYLMLDKSLGIIDA